MQRVEQLISTLISYISLAIIAIGLIGNSVSFILFRFDKDLRKISFSIYLSFLAITDTFSLFEWNLNHFLKPNFGIDIQNLSIFSCKLTSFLQLFSLQSSAYLLCFVSIDRYLTVMYRPGSFASKLPFRTKKSALMWSIIILMLIFILNSHLLILNGTMKLKKSSLKNNTLNKTTLTVNCYEYPNDLKIHALIDKLNLVLYSLIPSFIMIVFNFLLIKNTFLVGNLSNYRKRNFLNSSKRSRLTISIFSISILFVLMTLPSTVVYGFLYEEFHATRFGTEVAHLTDYFMFLNHSTLFLICFLTNSKFRQAFYNRFSIFRFFQD